MALSQEQINRMARGEPYGLATLGAGGELTIAQLPEVVIVRDVAATGALQVVTHNMGTVPRGAVAVLQDLTLAQITANAATQSAFSALSSTQGSVTLGCVGAVYTCVFFP